MVKEIYREEVNEIALNVTANKIDSVRKKSITKNGCRVYQDGYIGIAGCYGEATEDTWERANENLKNRIPYPYEPTKDLKRTRDLRELEVDETDFVKQMESFLDTVSKEFPQFLLSNKILLTETNISLTNDSGLELRNYDRTILVEIIVKHNESVNIFDSGIVYIGRTLDINRLLKEARELLSGFLKKCELPVMKRMPVIIQQNELLSKFNESLNGEAMARGISLFHGKMNEKLFNENLQICQNRGESNYHVPFFDMEGTVNEGDMLKLIENGVIHYTYTDKKNTADFDLPLTGAAGGAYDDVPTLSSPELSLVSNGKSLKEILDGKQAILVDLAAGGDYTSSGDFATPVQSSYLTDGERILGKLPELSISSNIFDMFGKDYMGYTADKPFSGLEFAVLEMNITK
ncbi:MAG TPA: metallopeptidase TldD-related protein [Lachnospiraceae bacterium]|nr:metallopeptidase TldD-related protein [Lachnospiraceae bacterium]